MWSLHRECLGSVLCGVFIESVRGVFIEKVYRGCFCGSVYGDF